MGSSSSKPACPAQTQTQHESFNEKQETAFERLSRLSISPTNMLQNSAASPNLTLDSIKQWDAEFRNVPANIFSQNILSKQDALQAILNRSAIIADEPVFNLRIPHEVGPVTNQKSSGRCWLFATTNVARIFVAKNLNLGDFQLSQSYLFFWDCLEKANYYLENVIDLADEPLDSRLHQFLNDAPEQDGGQWDFSVALIVRYGLVPCAVFPESHNSSYSSKLDSFLTSKLREYALELRHIYRHSSSDIEAAIKSCRSRKAEQLQEIYNILSISLGSPPQPNEEFTWDYYDKNGNPQNLKSTPLCFLANQAKGFKPEDHISIINDPRNDYAKAYFVSRYGNVWGSHPLRFVNTTAPRIREIIVSVLKKGQPVWFGCDVRQFSDRQLGILDPQMYDFENAFGTKRNLNKAQRLEVRDSSLTHVMVIVAAHIVDGKAVRFRVENSWSDTVGDKGYFVATAEWIDEFVYQVVADRSILPKDLVDVYEAEGAIELPPWDPLGRPF